jgi:hypothetical protein
MLAAFFNYANKNYQNILREFKSIAIIYLSGLISLAMGILSLLIYSSWSFDGKVLVTILGWIAVFKGVLRLFFPNLVLRVIDRGIRWYYCLVFPIFFGIGVYLIYVGFEF